MPMRVSDPILGAARGDGVTLFAYARNRGAPDLVKVTAYANTIYEVGPKAGVDPGVAAAQAVHETSDPDTGAPFASSWCLNRNNFAGMGVTGDPAENAASPRFASPEAGARAQIAHLLLYATGRIAAGGLVPADDPRYQAYRDAYGMVARAKTIAELTNTWGIDDGYADSLVARGNAIWPNLPDAGGTPDPPPPPPPGPTPGAKYWTDVPGLPGGPLGTSYPIFVKLIAVENVRQRPGTKAHTPRRSVQHGTGNPDNASAKAEAEYFIGGAQGRQASVHATINDHEAWVIVPLDEVTWQAADGGGPGNMNGYSCEQLEADAIWNDPARADAAIKISADFMGRCGARLGAAIPEQHWTFNAGDPNRHDCPDKLRHTPGAWDRYVSLWNAAKADELVWMRGGPPPTPTPTTTTTRPPTPTTTTTPPPGPPPPPTPTTTTTPPPPLPPGDDPPREVLAQLFGSVVGDDGRAYGYDPNGRVSAKWRSYAKGTGRYAHITGAYHQGGNLFCVFADGMLIEDDGTTARILVDGVRG